VRVDRARCQETGFCTQIAPNVFKLTGQGAEVSEHGLASVAIETIEEAEDACPTMAISVERTP
jgi:ferredoxin